MDLSPLSTAVSVMTSPSVSSYGVPRFYLTPAADGLPSSASREALPDRGMLSELGSRRTPSRLIHRPAIQDRLQPARRRRGKASGVGSHRIPNGEPGRCLDRLRVQDATYRPPDAGRVGALNVQP